MIAICVGHSRIGDMGALSVDGVSERCYNLDLATRIERKLQDLGHVVCVVFTYPRETYGAAMRWLAQELKACHAEAAIELHFNSSDDERSHGHEWLHWHASGAGRALAKALQTQMSNTFPSLKSRGLVPVLSSKNRGGGFLLHTPCPAVICEPFFGSNSAEWSLFAEEQEMLAEVIALGIDDWMGGVR